MPTLGDVRAAVLPRQSEATTLATSAASGGKYSIPIPHPHLKQSDPKLMLLTVRVSTIAVPSFGFCQKKEDEAWQSHYLERNQDRSPATC